MSAYIKQLELRVAAGQQFKSTLQQQFADWYGSLPEIVRNRSFSMLEFELALGTQGRYISPVLLELGWQRKRRWNSRGQYHRYWVAPQAEY